MSPGGSLDDISRAIGELQGQVAEVLRMYVRTDARIEQMSKDLTREVAETRDSWHRRANESQALLGKIDLELLQVREHYKQMVKDTEKLEVRVDRIETARRRTKGELRISAVTLGTIAAAAVEGAIKFWAWLHEGG